MASGTGRFKMTLSSLAILKITHMAFLILMCLLD